jgi:hypothetical protein
VRSPPDGYTLLLLNSSNTINATLYEKLNFDFIRDIAPITDQAMLAAKTIGARWSPGRCK